MRRTARRRSGVVGFFSRRLPATTSTCDDDERNPTRILYPTTPQSPGQPPWRGGEGAAWVTRVRGAGRVGGVHGPISTMVPFSTHLPWGTVIASMQGAAIPNCRLKIKVPKSHENGARIRQIQTRLCTPPGGSLACKCGDPLPTAAKSTDRKMGQPGSPISVVRSNTRNGRFQSDGGCR